MTFPTYVGTANIIAGTGNVNARIDVTGSIPGDLLVLMVITGNDTLSVPAGWNHVADSPQGTGTSGVAGSVGLNLIYRWADWTTTTTAATVAITDTGDHTITRCVAFRGVDTDDPFPVSSGGTEAGNDTSLSATGDTTTVDDTLVAIFAANSIDGVVVDQSSSWANADLANLTVRDFVQQGTGTGGGCNCVTGEKATVGSFTATTATYAANSNYAFVSLALRPARHPYLAARNTTITGGTGAISPGWPSGHQSGDVALFMLESCGGEPLVNTPSGLAVLANSPQATGATTTGTQLSMLWQRATSGAMSAPTFNDVGEHLIANVMVFRNCPGSGDPIHATSGNVKASADTSVSVAGVTTSEDDTLVLYVVTRDNDLALAEFDAWSNSNLSGQTEALDLGSTQGNGGGFGVWMGALQAAGPTGTTTGTMTNSNVNAFMCVALKSGLVVAGGARYFAQVVG